MATEPLGNHTPKRGDVYYLDTSAIFPLGYAAAYAKFGSLEVPLEVARSKGVEAFADVASKNGALLITTILSIEEIAAKVRGKARRTEIGALGHNDWQTFKRSNRAKAEGIDDTAHAAMLDFIEGVAQKLSENKIQLDCCSASSEMTVIIAKKQRKAHRELLRKYPAIDPADALHIVYGVAMQTTAFISADGGWGTVSEISVLSI